MRLGSECLLVEYAKTDCGSVSASIAYLIVRGWISRKANVKPVSGVLFWEQNIQQTS